MLSILLEKLFSTGVVPKERELYHEGIAVVEPRILSSKRRIRSCYYSENVKNVEIHLAPIYQVLQHHLFDILQIRAKIYVMKNWHNLFPQSSCSSLLKQLYRIEPPHSRETISFSSIVGNSESGVCDKSDQY